MQRKPKESDQLGLGHSIYSPREAAMQAGISRQKLEAWCRAGLIEPTRRKNGSAFYSTADIRHMRRIQRLQTELGLDLAAVEVVLHLREQVQILQQEVRELRQSLTQSQQATFSSVRQIRRQIVREAVWR